MDFWATTITAADLKAARHKARLYDLNEAAELAGIHKRTYQRQERGEVRPSLSIYRLFLSRAGFLPDRAFEGWRITKGQIWTPENVGATAGEIAALPYTYALIDELRRQLDMEPIYPRAGYVDVRALPPPGSRLQKRRPPDGGGGATVISFSR